MSLHTFRCKTLGISLLSSLALLTYSLGQCGSTSSGRRESSSYSGIGQPVQV